MKFNKRTSKPKKVNSGKIVDIFFNFIEWSLYVVFSILAAFFVKDVLDQYQAKETFMGQSLEPFTELPSIVLCLSTKYTWSYSEKIIRIRYTDDFNPRGRVYATLEENTTMRLPGANESIILNQVKSDCFRVKLIPGPTIKNGNRYFQVKFTDREPSAVFAYFVSEDNSYGQYNGDWYDGKPYRTVILPGHFVKLDIRQKKYTYVNHDEKCSNQTFVEQWMPYLLKANFSKSPKKCANNLMLASNELPLCGWGSGQNAKNRHGAQKVIYDSYTNFRKKIGHKRPCKVIEYTGETTSDNVKHSKNTFVMRFQFGSPGMTIHYTERLVFDLVGMVGSVGGTLGMCIGFSFSGLTSTVLDSIKSRVKSYF